MKVLLHVCCGVCSASVVERLRRENYKVTGFFYNPNIQPFAEYKKRLITARRISKILGFELLEGEYDLNPWIRKTKPFRRAPEGGERCRLCFSIRLSETYQLFKKLKTFDKFTTTLTVSPHKDAPLINELGLHIGGVYYLSRDFKKEDGYKHAIELAKEWDLYRQGYCGCVYSKV